MEKSKVNTQEKIKLDFDQRAEANDLLEAISNEDVDLEKIAFELIYLRSLHKPKGGGQ